MLTRKCGFYEKYVKRLLDIVCALLAIVVFSWLYLIIAVIVRLKMGSPVLFRQPRPGRIDPETGRERIFRMHKFRTMAEQDDEMGDPLISERICIMKGWLKPGQYDEALGILVKVDSVGVSSPLGKERDDVTFRG